MGGNKRGTLKAKSSSIFSADETDDDHPYMPISSMNNKFLITKSGWARAALFVITISVPLGFYFRNDFFHSSKIFVFESNPNSFSDVPFTKTNLFSFKSIFHSSPRIIHRTFNVAQQRQYLQKFGTQCYSASTNGDREYNNILLDLFENMNSKGLAYQNLATNLWKYCALYIHGGVFIDQDTIPLRQLEDILFYGKGDGGRGKRKELKINMAVISSNIVDNTPYVHDGFFFISIKESNVPKKMLEYLVGVNDNIVLTQPHFISKYLYFVIQQDVGKQKLSFGLNNDKWNMLEVRCQSIQQNQLQGKNYKKILTEESYLPQSFCPLFDGYCCSIYILQKKQPELLLITRHPLSQIPTKFPKSLDDIQTPYAHHTAHFNQSNIGANEKSVKLIQQQSPHIVNPYIATIREVKYTRDEKLQNIEPSRIFDFLLENDCLPTSTDCQKCLRSKKLEKGSCANCSEECKCYCSALCKYRLPEPFISKDYWVRIPQFRKHPDRIIPRIIHQTWYEVITKEKYPKMSRLIESWKNSDWDYNFYDDDAIETFLSTHFPVEIKEAFHAIIPGAFKADLFRYCALLIYGGVYADMDVLLESNLDQAIPPDVGFLVPIDEPGYEINNRHCLWNGLLAVAPGHPIIAKTIEIVVNNIRNRFTSVDYDHMFCPNQLLFLTNADAMLHTAGPCILGAAFNKVLGKHMLHQIKDGEVDIWEIDNPNTEPSPLPGVEREDNYEDPRLFMSGRTVILRQDKDDMGAHRFTLSDQNLIVAATDINDYEDRQNQESNHYSKTNKGFNIYGLKKLYRDQTPAHEKIRIFLERAD